MKRINLFLGITALFLSLAHFNFVPAQGASCFAPGNVVVTDSQDSSIPRFFDIESVYVGEPIYGDGSQKFAFSIKVVGLQPEIPGGVLPTGTWNVLFSGVSGPTRYVQMSTQLGAPAFSRGNVTYQLGVPIFNNEGAIQGTLGNDGMITMFVDKALVGDPQPGTQIMVSGVTYANAVAGLVLMDQSPSAQYTVVGTASCLPHWYVQFGLNGDIPVVNDYDRKGGDDIAVWRPATGVWYALDLVTNTLTQAQHGSGANGDIPVSGNYDYDSHADFMVYQPAKSNWSLLSTQTGAVTTTSHGAVGVIPLSGDFDGDWVDDRAVWQPSTGVWSILRSSDGNIQTSQFGVGEDLPLRADFDGDRKADIAVFRPSTGAWSWVRSVDGSVATVTWGVGTDVIAPGDYDGDGKTDPTVFRPGAGQWRILKSNTNAAEMVSWGLSGDKVVPGDYNGNGRDDLAVWRPSDNVWYIYLR